MVYGPYTARFLDAHDGDTIHLDVDLGFGFQLQAYNFGGHPVWSCRIFGINAPELHQAGGTAALDYLLTLIEPGALCSVVSHGWDAYSGRFDGSVTLADGRDLAALMLASGHAVAYP